MLLFYYLGGVGVRERSRYAAAIILCLYVSDTLTSGLRVVRVIFGALLISTLRATWIASAWKADSEEAILPPRLNPGVTNFPISFHRGFGQRSGWLTACFLFVSSSCLRSA